MNLAKLSAALIVLVSALAGAPAPATAADATLKFHVFVPPVTPIYQKLYVVWANNVMAASKDRIKIDMYPMMQLGGRPPQLIDQVRDGVVEVTTPSPATRRGASPSSRCSSCRSSSPRRPRPISR